MIQSSSYLACMTNCSSRIMKKRKCSCFVSSQIEFMNRNSNSSGATHLEAKYQFVSCSILDCKQQKTTLANVVQKEFTRRRLEIIHKWKEGRKQGLQMSGVRELGSRASTRDCSIGCPGNTTSLCPMNLIAQEALVAVVASICSRFCCLTPDDFAMNNF